MPSTARQKPAGPLHTETIRSGSKVDLGSVKTVGRVVIVWENSAALDYKIQLSSDGENWIDAIHKTDGKGGEETLSFSPQPARFVRFTGQFRIQQYGGYSFREFQVFEK